MAQPVLLLSGIKGPVTIASVELLRYKESFLCRVRSTDGAEGICICNNDQMISLYAFFVHRIAPFFKGKDALALEQWIEEVYVYESNYKFQSPALWLPVATVEFAILDMLGKLARKPIWALIGKQERPSVQVYRATNYRGMSAESSIEKIRQVVAETGAKAVKFKIGGRMSRNKDYPADRSEKLIPLMRQTFGDDMVIYADSNGSYDVPEAIRFGRMLEEYKIAFYEEPVPFDWYRETKAVKDALRIPIAGGEQEGSMRNFRWLIAEAALDVVQPDLFYFGGMVRSMKVARMAGSVGKICTPHISGNGVGYLYMLHFVAACPNAGPYHEFKGFAKDLPLEAPKEITTSMSGSVQVPMQAGLGVKLDPGFVAKHKVIT
jgi:L-alanine-DL-glutamate epimerase-like enolase superfamily enzyme